VIERDVDVVPQRLTHTHVQVLVGASSVRYPVFSVPVFRLPHEPATCCFGEFFGGSTTMKKSMRRVLERLRALLGGRFGGRTAVRDDVQSPQRMQAGSAPARSGPHG